MRGKEEQLTARSFSEKVRRILRLVQGDLPDSAEPFAAVAKQAGASVEEVLSLLSELKESGAVRRFGATLRHQKAGYGKNAMVAWRVPEERLEEVGRDMAARPEISHCYVRRTYPEWPYNLYTMIHGRDEGEVDQVVERMARATGIDEHEKLESLRELKKTSMTYF
jgi:DNA-binding Lrp family transcriptional regulator